MTQHLRPYADYIDSGIASLGKVPAHWEVRRLGQMGRIWKGQGGSKADETSAGISCVRYGDLYTSHEFFIQSTRSAIPEAVAESYTPIEFGDLLFASSGETIDDIGKSAVSLMRSEARCGGDVLVFRSRYPVDARYLGYTVGCRPVVVQKAAMGRGITIMHIYADQLKRLALPLPPLPEQTSIARFLDYMDGRIRRAIREKEKLLALLQEQQGAAIEQAVTGGIDLRTGEPFTAYKDSGVDWLPKVPAEWERHRLKALLQTVDQRSSTGSETLLSLRRDHGVVVYAEHFTRPPTATSLVGFKLVTAGQLVVNRLQANNGLVFRSDLDGLVSPDYSVFQRRPGKAFHMRYLSDLLRTTRCRAHFRRESTGLGTGTAGFLRLYDDRFLATTVYLPTKAAQERILDWSDSTTARTARRIDRANRQIALLREYWGRLVADVVTGKVDVRKSTADLSNAHPPSNATAAGSA